MTQSYFAVPKDIKLNTTHFFVIKLQNKRELQQIAFNHSSFNQSWLREFQLKFFSNSIIWSDIFMIVHWNVWGFIGGTEARFYSSCENAVV